MLSIDLTCKEAWEESQGATVNQMRKEHGKCQQDTLAVSVRLSAVAVPGSHAFFYSHFRYEVECASRLSVKSC